MQMKFIEHGWATLMSLYPGVEYSYTDSEHWYANILRWDEPQQNYHCSGLAVIVTTRCTYVAVWAMCIPFFVIRRSIWAYVKAILISGLFVSIINIIRLTIAYGAAYADIPWWLAHDVPNIMFGLVALGLSVGYFLSKLSAPQKSQAQPAGATNTEWV